MTDAKCEARQKRNNRAVMLGILVALFLVYGTIATRSFLRGDIAEAVMWLAVGVCFSIASATPLITGSKPKR